ncbi:hypothetical protein [Ideonella sp. BN130291]|uniref:hypothetical protein n=1 Tax=Ideonella sp. BN130291 TaxID=3112940 RepID=UPI002E270589|nr:hypothetical protein [Ideonella sp. BN130291]
MDKSKAATAAHKGERVRFMDALPGGSGFPARWPGWCGALQRGIALAKRGAILCLGFAALHRGRHQLAGMLLMVLVSIGIGVKAHACEADLAGQSSDYRALRQTPGHFSGGPWNTAVDAWRGRKHRLMQQLADCALQRQVSEAQLRQWMGPPDAVMDCASGACAGVTGRVQALQAAAPTHLWLYDWRGHHDRLAFALSGGAVRARGWLLDGE